MELRTLGSEGRRMLWTVGLTMAVAGALDAAAVVLAVTTILGPSCGEDLAWVGLFCGAGIATAAAALGVLGLIRWWRRGGSAHDNRWMTRSLGLALGLSLALTVLAAFWLPDGGCDADQRGFSAAPETR